MILCERALRTISGKRVTKSTRSIVRKVPRLRKATGNIPTELNVPADLKYTKTHEWVRTDGDTATIGITDHAQSELGDIVFVEMPEVGRALAQGDPFGTVESVKTVSDLYAPLAGEVVETNGTLGAQSELVNTDPYGGGWMVKVKLSDPSQLGSLLSADAYATSLDN